jgi:hypothetical protein
VTETIFKDHFKAFFNQLAYAQQILINLWYVENIRNCFCAYSAGYGDCPSSFDRDVITIANFDFSNISRPQISKEFLVIGHVVGTTTVN